MHLNSAQKSTTAISLMFIFLGLVGVVIFGLDFFKQAPDFREDFRLYGLAASIIAILWTAYCTTWIKGLEDR